MLESDARRRLISSTTRLTRDEIVNQPFPVAFRGLSEPAVRAFLRRLADDYESLRVRVDELLDLSRELEDRVAHPPPLDEQDLLTAVGEETARVLRQAREAAEEIRRSGEARAAQLLEEAQEQARALREQTELASAERAREADEAMARVLHEAERLAREMQEAAEARAADPGRRAAPEARAELEAARQRGKEMVAEAQAARDRILNELSRRREALEAQVAALREGRDRLLESYRVVKRTLEEATEALRAADGRVAEVGAVAAASTGPRPQEVPEAPVEEAVDLASSAGPRVASYTLGELEPAAEPAPPPSGIRVLGPAAAPAEAGKDVAEPRGPQEEVPVPARPIDVAYGEGTGGSLGSGPPDPARRRPAVSETNVEQLFARLKAERDEPTVDAGEPAPAEAEAEATTPSGDVPDADATVISGAGGAEAADGAATDPDAELLRRRRDVLEPHVDGVVRSIKRLVRDEQNLVLEALRRHRGVPAPEEVLPDREAQVLSFTEALTPPLVEAWRAGSSAVHVLGVERGTPDLDPTPSVAELARALVDEVVVPLHERLAGALWEAAGDGDAEDKLRARYREWKSRPLEDPVRDTLAAAFARGVYDTVAMGTPLRWVVDDTTPCPDCEDNSLEPTARGAAFPTGHAVPPAHPGCRCLVVPLEAAPAAG